MRALITLVLAALPLVPASMRAVAAPQAGAAPQAAAAAPQEPAAGNPAPPTRRVGTMSDLMVHLIYPTSDAIFYISTRIPQNDAEWNELKAKTLILAESANLLMLPGRARDTGQWMEDARLMLDAGTAAFQAASNRDVAALEALSERLYQSCTACHQHYRPSYGRRRP